MKKATKEKAQAIGINPDTARIVESYRAIHVPIPTKQAAVADLIRIGWEAAKKKAVSK